MRDSGGNIVAAGCAAYNVRDGCLALNHISVPTNAK